MTFELLDADELFAIGARSSMAGDSAAALTHFKLAIAKSPTHALAHWAIATEYVTLRLHERALAHYARVIELEPKQPLPRFRYGMLCLTLGDQDKARSVWGPLDELPEGAALRHFKNGLLQMVAGQFDAAIALLQAGLADHTVDLALRRDMATTLQRLEAGRAAQQQGATPSGPAAASPAPGAPAAAEPAPETAASHLAWSAYAGTAPDRH